MKLYNRFNHMVRIRDWKQIDSFSDDELKELLCTNDGIGSKGKEFVLDELKKRVIKQGYYQCEEDIMRREAIEASR